MAPRKRPRERGAAAVEFALVLPLLFLVIAGIVDFGRALYTEVILTNAAREGVRAAVMADTSQTQSQVLANVQSRARVAAVGLDVSPAKLGITLPQYCGGTTPINGSVNVVYKFDWLMLGPALKLISAGTAPNLPDLSAGAVMQCGG